MTTRAPRAGEIDGIHYSFVDRDTFAATEMIESVTFNGNWYGVPACQLENDSIFVAVVEPVGMEQIRKYCNEHRMQHVGVYLYVDSTTLAQRFVDRYRKQLMESSDVEATWTDMSKRLANILEEEMTWEPIAPVLACCVRATMNKDNQEELVRNIISRIRNGY